MTGQIEATSEGQSGTPESVWPAWSYSPRVLGTIVAVKLAESDVIDRFLIPLECLRIESLEVRQNRPEQP